MQWLMDGIAKQLMVENEFRSMETSRLSEQSLSITGNATFESEGVRDAQGSSRVVLLYSSTMRT